MVPAERFSFLGSSQPEVSQDEHTANIHNVSREQLNTDTNNIYIYIYLCIYDYHGCLCFSTLSTPLSSFAFSQHQQQNHKCYH